MISHLLTVRSPCVGENHDTIGTTCARETLGGEGKTLLHQTQRHQLGVEETEGSGEP